jgi:hypothetical protein
MWGFLGPGVVDTLDVSRGYRRPLIDALAGAGHEIVFLQANRDLREVGDDLRHRYRWDAGLPDLDAVVLEWRWPLPGRNTTVCGAAGHTCDLHRRDDLISHYTRSLGVPTVIWDLDRRLPVDDPLRRLPQVTVCEFALRPTPGAVTLRCPVPDAALDAADPAALAGVPRPVSLVYVGNQYDRDAAFDRFFAPAALWFPHRVAGKWTHTQAWPHVHLHRPLRVRPGRADPPAGAGNGATAPGPVRRRRAHDVATVRGTARRLPPDRPGRHHLRGGVRTLRAARRRRASGDRTDRVAAAHRWQPTAAPPNPNPSVE